MDDAADPGEEVPPKKKKFTRKKPKAGSFDRLIGLGPERLSLLENRLVKGVAAYQLARMIQDDWKEFTDVSHTSLTRQLARYYATTLKSERVLRETKTIPPKVKQEMLTQLSNTLNVMSELEGLALMQRARINKLYEREKTMPMLISSLREEVKVQVGTLKSLADLQLEVGVLRRASLKFEGILGVATTSEIDRLKAAGRVQDSVAEATLLAMRELGILDYGGPLEGEVTVVEAGND